LSQASYGEGLPLLGTTFFDGVITCYIILHCKEQQVTLIYFIYLTYIFCFLSVRYLPPPYPYWHAKK